MQPTPRRRKARRQPAVRPSWERRCRALCWAPAAGLLAVLSAGAVLLGATPSPAAGAHGSVSHTKPLLHSRLLWATVNVCGAADQPNTIGIRGSMPGDGHRKDAMFMRFRVQFLDRVTQQWVDVGRTADSGFVSVGSAGSARQAGRSFQFLPTSTGFTLRGAVTFQWRRGGRVVHLTSRASSADHISVAGADPAGFSAATCALP